MALPAIQGSSLPTSVCGKNERVPIDQMTSPPFKWICSLSIDSADGTKYYGSGFKIHLPDVNRNVIVTSGSCICVKREYATKITVQFPKQKPVEVGTNGFYAAPEYINGGSADHDYGLILLPQDSDDVKDYGFSWSAIVQDEELNNCVVVNCGYPGDKPEGTMWIKGGKIESVTRNRIFYMNDAKGGQSGSPVFTWNGSYWTVVGVHSCSGHPNSATKFTTEMIFRFLKRMNWLKSKSIRFVAYPDVYVRCDGLKGTTASGTINCQYKLSPFARLFAGWFVGWFGPGLFESFYIYPVEMSPSLTGQGITKVVIESARFRNVFIRMDSKGMSQTDHGSGGGEVNCCQFSEPGP